MHIGFISTRLNGTDGVSLEVEKWAKVLRRMGHELFYCAGELGGYASGGTLIPQLHFDHQNIISFSQRAFGEGSLERDGEKLADYISQRPFTGFVAVFIIFWLTFYLVYGLLNSGFPQPSELGL